MHALYFEKPRGNNNIIRSTAPRGRISLFLYFAHFSSAALVLQTVYYYHHITYGSFVFVNNPLIAGEDWPTITGNRRRLIDTEHKTWNAIYRERACAKKTCLTERHQDRGGAQRTTDDGFSSD